VLPLVVKRTSTVELIADKPPLETNLPLLRVAVFKETNPDVVKVNVPKLSDAPEVSVSVPALRVVSIIGSFVTFGMVILSVEAGTPDGLQLDDVRQLVLVEPVHVLAV